MKPDTDLPDFTKLVRLGWLLPASIWAVVIFVIISMSPDHIPETSLLDFPHADKAVHFLLFAILGVLLILGLGKQAGNRQNGAMHILMALLIGLAYGILTEYYQHCCLPERHGNIPDIIANAFGTIFGVFLMAMGLQPRFRKIIGRN